MHSNLSPYRLPSNKNAKVTFRKPLVEDEINFCARLPEQDEKVASEYLNTLLVKAEGISNQSEDWSVEDRLAALIWIYIHINPDSRLDWKYECNHCGEEHVGEVDLMELDEELLQIDSLERPQFDLKLQGRKRKITLHELTGRAAEKLQDLSNGIDDLDEGAKKQRRLMLKVDELMHRLSFDDEPEGYDEALQYRFDLLRSLDALEFNLLQLKVNEHIDTLRHGYHAQWVDGVYYLVSPALQCDNKQEDKNATQRLMFPAKCSYFISQI